jgi:hypothetical protein
MICLRTKFHLPTNIMFLDIIQRPVYISKNVSETGSCLHLQVKRTQLGPINRASPYLLSNSID